MTRSEPQGPRKMVWKPAEDADSRVKYAASSGAPDARRSVREGIERFRAILDLSSEAILIWNCQTRSVVDANETAVRWLRIPRDRLLSLSVDDLDVEFPLEPPETLVDHQAETRKSHRAWVSSAGVHRRRNGTWFPVEVTLKEQSFGDGSYLLVVARESKGRRTAEEALRQSEDKYRALFDLSNDAIYLTSRDGTVIEANAAAEQIFGGGITGVQARTLYSDVADIRRFQQDVEEKGAARDLATSFLRRDGTTFTACLTATLRHAGDGSILGYQCVVRSTDAVDPTGPEHSAGVSAPEPDLPDGVEVQSVSVWSQDLRLPERIPVHSSGGGTKSRPMQLWFGPLSLGIVASAIAWSNVVHVGYPYGGGELIWAWIVRSVGCLLVLVGVAGRDRLALTRSVALTVATLAAVLVVVAVDFVMGLPFDLARVVPGAWADIRTAVLVSTVFTLCYSGSSSLVAWYLWRSARRRDSSTVLA